MLPGARRTLLQLGPALVFSSHPLKTGGVDYGTLARLSFGMDASFAWLW